MGIERLVQREYQALTQRENTLKTLLFHFTEYLGHIDGMVINFRSITDSLKEFFPDKSTYFASNVRLGDQLNGIRSELIKHRESFVGLEQKLYPVKELFLKAKV